MDTGSASALLQRHHCEALSAARRLIEAACAVETELRRRPIDRADEFSWDAVRLQLVV